MIKLDSIIIQADDCIESELDNEVVMMSIEQGEYYGLGEVGSQIWRLIEQPITVQQIIDKCIEQYEVDVAQCQKDVLSFLTQLSDKDLISYS